MKHVVKRDIAPFFEDMVSLFRQAEQAGAHTYIQTALTYLFTVSEENSKTVFLETARRHLLTETENTMITIAQQLEAEGFAEGKAEVKKSVALKMLQAGIDFENISRLTDLPLEMILELAGDKI